MTKPESPCLGCLKRNGRCHSECKLYKDYLKAWKVYKDLIKEQRNQPLKEYKFNSVLNARAKEYRKRRR